MTASRPQGDSLPLVLSTISFALCFAAWGLIAALVPRFRETLHLSATQAAFLVAVPTLLGSLMRRSRLDLFAQQIRVSRSMSTSWPRQIMWKYRYRTRRERRYDLAINGLQQKLEHQGGRAEAAAGRADGKVEALIEACPRAVISLDLDGDVKMPSRGAEQIFGWREGQVLGNKLPTLPQAYEQAYLRFLDSQLTCTSLRGWKCIGSDKPVFSK